MVQKQVRHVEQSLDVKMIDREEENDDDGMEIAAKSKDL